MRLRSNRFVSPSNSPLFNGCAALRVDMPTEMACAQVAATVQAGLAPQTPDTKQSLSVAPEMTFLKTAPALSRRERRVLTSALIMREIYRAELDGMNKDKKIRLDEFKSNREAALTFWTGGDNILSQVLNYFIGPEKFATAMTFGAQDDYQKKMQQIDDQQRPRKREVSDFACDREERYRARLAQASPYAKRLFNEISVTGRSLTHFPPAEIAAAQQLPAFPARPRF